MKKFSVRYGSINLMDCGRSIIIWAKDKDKAYKLARQYEESYEYIQSVTEIKE